MKARYEILKEAKAAVELELQVTKQAAAKAEEKLRSREKELEERAETNESTLSNGDNEGQASEETEKDQIEEDTANKPRFTLEELRQVLIDRIEWKMKAEDLQEQIARLKQRCSICYVYADQYIRVDRLLLSASSPNRSIMYLQY